MDDPSQADPKTFFTYQMSLAFAAIHTTSQATFHAILDMAASPSVMRLTE